MADHIIETNFFLEVLDRANRRVKRMWTRFSCQSTGPFRKKVDEDERGYDDL